MGLFDQLLPVLDKHGKKLSSNMQVMMDELVAIRHAVEAGSVDPNVTIMRATLNAASPTLLVPNGQTYEINYISANNGDVDLSVNGVRVMGHATSTTAIGGGGLILQGGDTLLFTPAGATVLYLQAKVTMLNKKRSRNRSPGESHNDTGPPMGAEHRADLLSATVVSPTDPTDRIHS